MLCGPLGTHIFCRGAQMSNELLATYAIPRQGDWPRRAEEMAVGMTVGSWTDLPALEQERLTAFLGRVTRCDAVSDDWAHVQIAYPAANLPPQLSAVLTVAFGKLSLDSPIRLVGLSLPDSWPKALPGPHHGAAGVRQRLGVPARPLLLSIFKSENGRTLAEFAHALDQQWAGGADIVKDDEIFFADQAAPLGERVRAARDLASSLAARSGRPAPLYAANLTASGDRAVDQAATAMAAGAEAFLVSPYAMGLDTLAALSRLEPHPILLSHPAFAGAFISTSGHGVAASVALGVLTRAAGADIGIFPSPYGSVALPRAEAQAVGQALCGPAVRRPALPAPAAGLHPGLVPQLVGDFGSDVVINAGGAIHGHPDGTQAGARAFRAAIDRLSHPDGPVPPELLAAWAKWGAGPR